MSAAGHPEESGRIWRLADRTLQFGHLPLLMGIVNVTPDSFSDGGRFSSARDAVAHALTLEEEGADILDVGGESTRPGAAHVSIGDELARVLPVVEALATRARVPISIDTTKGEVARQALKAGASIVNDVSGLRFDDDMAAICQEAGAGVVCMHMQGTPQTMQTEPRYENVVEDVRGFLSERLQTLSDAGISVDRIVLDPGIGFGKTAAHNVEILSNIARLRELGRPILIGHSRKRFLAKVLGRPVEERQAGTLGIAVALAAQQTEILRVHDVRGVRDALLAWSAISRVG